MPTFKLKLSRKWLREADRLDRQACMESLASFLGCDVPEAGDDRHLDAVRMLEDERRKHGETSQQHIAMRRDRDRILRIVAELEELVPVPADTRSFQGGRLSENEAKHEGRAYLYRGGRKSRSAQRRLEGNSRERLRTLRQIGRLEDRPERYETVGEDFPTWPD